MCVNVLWCTSDQVLLDIFLCLLAGVSVALMHRNILNKYQQTSSHAPRLTSPRAASQCRKFFKMKSFNWSIVGAFSANGPTLSFKRTCHPAYNVRISAEKGNRGTKSIGGWEIQAGARDACQKDKQLTHLFHLRSVALTLAQRWHCLGHWAWHWQNWQRVWRVS